MKRDIYKQLVSWKQSPSRKPLVLKGARQVGKTYILKKFGEGDYGSVEYSNFEKDPDPNEIFTGRLLPEKIIDTLSVYHESRILSDHTLIIFDEIQNSPLTLISLKYFIRIQTSVFEGTLTKAKFEEMKLRTNEFINCMGFFLLVFGLIASYNHKYE